MPKHLICICMKYTEATIVFREVPDETTLAVNISGCPVRCPSCHSKWLWDYVGSVLDEDTLLRLIEDNKGITCVALMGGDADPRRVAELLIAVRRKYGRGLKTCWYSGRDLETALRYVGPNALDYLKVGPYIESRGPLDNPRTNQRMYHIERREGPFGTIDTHYIDITSRFWQKTHQE